MNCFTHTQLWRSDPTLWSAVTLRFPAITSSPPTPISKSTPRHLRHCHLLIITRSAARGLLSDMAARRAFHLNSHTHVFQPQPITHFDTHIGMCAHTNPHVHGGEGKNKTHRFRNTELRLLLDVATPLFVSSPRSFLCLLLAPLR